MRALVSAILLAAVATAGYIPSSSSPSRLFKRADLDTCDDLTISSNNGDRKVAIVIDESSSMASSDPLQYSVSAARNLNGFLQKGEKPDIVTVVTFSGDASLEYPLGDPKQADAVISAIGNDGSGTLIASGVELALEQLLSGGGDTDKRTAIVVFTDGEDSSVDRLATAINDAASKGIRVSFGFLTNTAGSQDTEVLKAIRASRGIYATIADAAGSQNFVNYAILNGLTYNDNPQGYDLQLLSGLGQTYVISGSDTITLKYQATKGEHLNFTIESISAGELKVEARQNGQTIGSTGSGLFTSFVDIPAAPSSGEINVAVKANNADPDSLFSILTNSNVPIKNCTVGVKKSGGLPAAGKAGVGVAAGLVGLGILGTGAYFLLKHFHPPTPTAPPGPSGAETFNKIAPEVTVNSIPPPDGGSAPFVPPIIPPVPPNAMSKPTGQPQGHDGQDPRTDRDMQSNNQTYQGDNKYMDPTNSGDQPPTEPRTDAQPPPENQEPPNRPELPENPPRIPKIKRGVIEKHHHHDYLEPEQACLAEHCEYNMEDHRCHPDEHNCPCTCRIPDCPVTKEREKEQRQKDIVHTALANAL